MGKGIDRSWMGDGKNLSYFGLGSDLMMVGQQKIH